MIARIFVCLLLGPAPVVVAQVASGDGSAATPGPNAVQEPVPQFLEQYRSAAIEKWEESITKLEQRDAAEVDPADGILFLGSSSIRRWDDIAIDMAPYRPIQRGYGGAKYGDVAVFAERLIRPHQYRALVIFVANDVSGKADDRSPRQVGECVRHVMQVSRQHQPHAPVLLIEVTPTEKRWAVWDKIRQVNARLREIALSTPDTYFIATASHFLRPDGTPRSELFVEDKLHLNQAGYDVWSSLIRRRLDEVFRWMAEPTPTDASDAQTVEPAT